jgi:vitamin B12 transporter
MTILTSKALFRATTALVAMGAAAPSAFAQDPTPLPGIIIEGATLERPRPQPPRVVVAPEPRPARPAATSQKQQATSKQAAPPAAASAPAPLANESAAEPASTVAPSRSELATSVTVVTGETLRQTQVRTAAQALENLPGLSVNKTGGAGSLTEVRIRGAEANHTLVVIDGIIANSANDGQFDLSNLSAEDIESIEVIRGPMSGIYGSGAVGGVINVITRVPRRPLSLTVRSEFGSMNTRDVAARLSGGNENGYISLSGHWRATDGFNIAPQTLPPFDADRDGTRLGNFALRAGGRIAPGAMLDVTLSQTIKNLHRDGFGGNPGSISTAIDDPSRARDDVLLAGVRLSWDSLGGALSQSIKGNYNRTNSSDTDISSFAGFPNPPFLFDNVAERTTVGYNATYRFATPSLLGAKHAVSGQIEHETETFTSLGDFGDGLTRKRDRLSFAGEWRTMFANGLALTGGVRHDNNDVFRDYTTWRAGATWTLASYGLRPHASIGTGVKAPALFEQFGKFPSFFVANPDLKPEESRGYDVGVEWSIPGTRAVLDVTYFNADLRNKIVTGPGFPGPSLVNSAGTAHREGIEFAVKTPILPALMLSAAYTYLDASEADGTAEVRRPRHSGRIDLTATFAGGRGTATLGVKYNGDRTDYLFINDPLLGFPALSGRAPIEGVWLTNAAVSYKLQPNVELFGRVENIFDVKYQDVYGYNTAGLAAYGGVRITFDDIAGTRASAR